MHNCMSREIYERYHASYRGKEDIHTKLMRRYKDIPSWWFYLLLAVTLAASFVLCIFLNDQIQMPWWGLLFAGAMAFTFTLPISIITATTNQVTGFISFHLFFSYLEFTWRTKNHKKRRSLNSTKTQDTKVQMYNDILLQFHIASN
jgi:K+-sensing histidine kinase KdpD